MSPNPSRRSRRIAVKLWPLGRNDWLAIRVASLFLSPVSGSRRLFWLRIGWRLAYQLALVALAAMECRICSNAGRRALTCCDSCRLRRRYRTTDASALARNADGTLDPLCGTFIDGSYDYYRMTGGVLEREALPVILWSSSWRSARRRKC